MSSLDVHVAESIFYDAILELLVKRNKTVLLVTSHYKFIDAEKYDVVCLRDGMVLKKK
jgi:ABC-type ATPase involved in cell division